MLQEYWVCSSTKVTLIVFNRENMKIIFCPGTKNLELTQYVNQFLVWHKKFGASPKIFGTRKRTRHKSTLQLEAKNVL